MRLKPFVLVGALIAAVMAVVLFKNCGHDVVVDPKTDKTIDSLATTRGADSARRDSLRQTETQSNANADARLRSAEDRARASARARARADSIAAEAALDATKWKAAHDARLAETDSLRAEIDTLKRTERDRNAAALAAGIRANEAEARLAVSENTLVDLREQVRRVNTCEINLLVTKVRCPTRTQAAVGGVVLGAVIYYAVDSQIGDDEKIVIVR